jgi:predicted 3-demethylubiquinone-9 3-methyltransferase (glyoxalase superfamily)
MRATNQRIIPFLTFHGNGEEALNFYAACLPGAKIESVTRFGKEDRGDEGKLMTGILSFMDQQIMFMDMNGEYDCPAFTWSTSFYLDCSDEGEFDAVFHALAQGGTVMMHEEPFMEFRKVAWVTDKYGITWQPVLK